MSKETLELAHAKIDEILKETGTRMPGGVAANVFDALPEDHAAIWVDSSYSGSNNAVPA